jgi:hypothetical protein
MRPSTIAVSLLAVATSAAPTFPSLDLSDAVNAGDTLESMSAYFNVLATRVQLAQAVDEPPSCDVSSAQMPQAPVPLPAPAAGLYIKHVAVGRGTQNYTCEAGNAAAKPKANGAVATLFNTSCVAALYPDLLERIPGMAMQFDLTDADALGPSRLETSGLHYFTNATTPFFNLDSDAGQFGQVHVAKNDSQVAPSTASVGRLGEAAVPWLRLTSIPGATGDLREVFRVFTAGGSAPATCEGQPATFEVQYAAVYYFWAGQPAE